MKHTEIIQMDARTGEVIDGATLALHYPKRSNGFQHGGWMAVGQTPMDVAAQLKLGEEAYRLLFYTLSRLDYENLLVLSQADAGKRLDMKKQNVNRALRKLIDAEIVLQGPTISGKPTFRLNPTFGWKGSAANHRKALSDQMKDAMKRARITEVIEGSKA